MAAPPCASANDRFHPIANIFPLLEGEFLDALATDIKAHDLREPIVEFEGRILDGRNRYLACVQANRPPRFVDYDGHDPLAYVLSANLLRRHLSEGQRAMIASTLANMPQGHPEGKPANLPVSQNTAARLLGVSERLVRSAKAVRIKAVPALIKRAERGEIAISLAAKLAELPSEMQAEIAENDEAKLRGLVKKNARSAREQALGAATRRAAETLGSKIYAVVYADPPWQFAPYSQETGMDRSADNHYPTMTVDAISALKVPASDDAVLFLWATAPILPDALVVMSAWGFAYKSHFVWVKDRIGTGYWSRNKHELLLVGTRGKIPAPAPGDQFASVIEAPVGRHSEKPKDFALLIEGMFPNTPKIELFGRGFRLGWDVWGNEGLDDFRDSVP